VDIKIPVDLEVAFRWNRKKGERLHGASTFSGRYLHVTVNHLEAYKER